MRKKILHLLCIQQKRSISKIYENINVCVVTGKTFPVTGIQNDHEIDINKRNFDQKWECKKKKEGMYSQLFMCIE